LAISSILLAASFVVSEASPLQQTAPTLGTASSFAVLGGQTVTNTGPTTVHGDLGVSPGTAVTGFPPGTMVGGSIHAADALAGQAQADTTTAYNNLAGQACPAPNNLTGQDLGGLTKVAGVYCYSSSAQLTGTLTLDAANNPNAVFIFQIGSTLTTATNSAVRMINGGSPCNVYWQVGSSATLGTTTDFMGTIVALTSISLTTGARVSGRALARNGAVTMDTNTIGTANCAVGVATVTPTASATTAPAPQSNPTPRPAPTANLPATSAPAAVPAATQTAVIAATSTAVIAATSTAVTAATATAAATPRPAAESTGVAATATALALVASQSQTGGVGPTSTAIAAATATAAALAPQAAIPQTSITTVDVVPTPRATTPSGFAGRAGGFDPLLVVGGLIVLGMLVLGAGLLRRRRAASS
jgi:type VI secretion system secreted protein VgrG